MRIAVVTEISTVSKNNDIIKALQNTGHTVFNCGMSSDCDGPELTYIHTGLISALLLNVNAADFVIGGCGTGQGYLNSVLQYPGVSCALVTEPLDAWLAKRINHINCLSLALNKGYGWAADLNLGFILNEILSDENADGYPASRAESQKQSRLLLSSISEAVHLSFPEILRRIDSGILKTALSSNRFLEAVDAAPDSELKELLLSYR